MLLIIIQNFHSETVKVNFNAFVNKMFQGDDYPEFMKMVIDGLSMTELQNIIQHFTEMLQFYPDFKKYVPILLMSALKRNFSVKDLIASASMDNPGAVAKYLAYVKSHAPADALEKDLALAGNQPETEK